MANPPPPIGCVQEHSQGTTEVRNRSTSFQDILGDGETLTGTPLLTSNPTGLTFTNIAVNTVAYTNDEGDTIAVGKGVNWTVGPGGMAEQKYSVNVKCATTDGQVLTVPCVLYVLTDT